MTAYDCDLFVIGAGSGGVRASRMAGVKGKRVIVADAGPLGGTCVNVGCIPKKLYSYASHYGESFEEARGYGWQVALPTFQWSELKLRRAAEISRLNTIYASLLDDAGVRLLRGWAKLIDPHTVQVGEERFTAEHILIATGGRPHTPHVVGHEHILSSDDMFDLDPFPKRLVVVGGGYIACEFASIFQGLGSRVTQVYRGRGILRGFDEEVAEFALSELRKKGLEVRLRTEVDHIEKHAGGLTLKLKGGSTLECDAVLYATGRRPNVKGLGVDAVDVALNGDGAIVVDAHFQTSVPSIYAIGDVVARKTLTPVALAEAMALIDHLYGGNRHAPDYELVPTAVFTHPNIGTVGWSEESARGHFRHIRVYRSEFRALLHTLSGSDERTLMKLVVDDATDRVLGVHMVGPEAGEIIQGFAVALTAGVTKAQFDRTLGIHPTMAEEFVTMRVPVATK
ncbi:MAG: glutathione-disulfide reductase [Rhizobacter sp.]|jgi:glutathione reductase (NADPH)|nr:glutathione-disulfide reductase [Rhizobacter sp.]